MCVCVVGCVVSVAAPKRGSNVATVGVAVLAGKQNETRSNQSMYVCMYPQVALIQSPAAAGSLLHPRPRRH